MAILLVVPVSGGGVPTAEAAVWRGYDARVLEVKAPSSLAPGERAEVSVRLRNTGDKAWRSDVRDYISLYHWDPVRKVEVASPLADASWNGAHRPVRLSGAGIGKGGETTLRFFVKAPTTAGTYTGEFILAAEDVAWIKESRFQVTIRVTGAGTASAPVPNAPSAPAATTPTAFTASYPEDTTGRLAARVTNGGGVSWSVEAGQDIPVRFSYQNTGEVPWEAGGVDAMRLVPLDAEGRLRSSGFWHPLWSARDQVAPLSGHISLGGDANFALSLRAPETPGSYRERFALVTASGKRVAGSVIELPITVTPGTGFVATDVSDLQADAGTAAPTPAQNLPSVQLPGNDGSLVAVPFLRSAQEVNLLGNGRQQLTIGWKNTGRDAWSKIGLRLVSSDPWVRASWLADTTWSDSRPPEASIQVKSGEVGFYSFYVKAPPKRGTYSLAFRLFANGQPVQGGDIVVAVRVTADGVIPADPTPVPRPTTPATPSTPVAQPPLVAQPLGGDSSSLPAEPSIRVGIYQPPHGRLQVTGRQSGMEVRSNGSVVCQLGSGQTVTVEYQRSSAKYVLTGPEACNGNSALPYVVRATDGLSPLEVSDFVRPSTWISNATDNKFRTQLELRLSRDGNQLWVINELPIEWYLKGIAETSNSSPAEFQRTLLVAARTYAMYHVNRGGTKHANEYFTVDATLDQLYRGYAIEQRAPTIAAAAAATRAQIVTYNGRLAITPYFSRSDGRTRSWGEVWAGGSSYPWLVGVPVPQDEGRTLWGHGVGMSATGALAMANEGRRYDQILKYFYTGIEILQVYR